MIGWNILYVKKAALQIVLIIILEKSESIHISLYLLKKYWLFIILIKSVVNQNKNEHYYNTFLEKGLYKSKSNAKYFWMNVCTL